MMSWTFIATSVSEGPRVAETSDPISTEMSLCSLSSHLRLHRRLAGRLDFLRGKDQAQRLRKAADAQLGHDVGAVDFDGARADPQVVGDGLVGEALGETIQDLTLTRRQHLQPDHRIFGASATVAG